MNTPRDTFRQQVLNRDQGLCVVCHDPAVDAHHLMNRDLWESGGYDPNNGVSLCEKHHIEAEETILLPHQLRALAAITTIVLPPDFDPDTNYDCWGNTVLESGLRTKGPLFNTKACQKALSNFLNIFLPYYKYPKTLHLPWSPGVQSDDRVHPNTEFFDGQEVVVSIKMDGECTTMYPDYMHARSINSSNHPSRSWVKALHGRISYDIPSGYRICGENLFARHSIHYHLLEDLFLVYSIWDESNTCLSWEDTLTWCQLLGLKPVPVLITGTWPIPNLQETYERYVSESKDEVEGYVVRLSGRFPYTQFQKSTAKYVRKGHVQTSTHWMDERVIPNEVK